MFMIKLALWFLLKKKKLQWEASPDFSHAFTFLMKNGNIGAFVTHFFSICLLIVYDI